MISGCGKLKDMGMEWGGSAQAMTGILGAQMASCQPKAPSPLRSAGALHIELASATRFSEARCKPKVGGWFRYLGGAAAPALPRI